MHYYEYRTQKFPKLSDDTKYYFCFKKFNYFVKNNFQTNYTFTL